MKRLGSRLVLAAMGLGGLWIAGALPAAGTSRADAATAPTCTPGQLALSVISSQGGVGHIGDEFRFRNSSTHACSLYGYPGAQLLDAHLHKMKTTVQRGGGYLSGNPRKVRVTLAPGGSGYFVLEWSHVTSGPKPCASASYVRVTPPNDYSAIQLKLGPQYAIDACGGGLIATPVLSKRLW